MKRIALLIGLATLIVSCDLFQDKNQVAIEICQKAKVTFQNSEVETSLFNTYGLTPNTTWLDFADIIAKREPNRKYTWQAKSTGENNVYMVSFVDENNWGQHWEVDIEQKIVKDINQNDYLSRKYGFSRMDADSLFTVRDLEENGLKIQNSYFGNRGVVYVLKGTVVNNTDKEITSAQLEGTLKLIFKDKTVEVGGNYSSGFEEGISENKPWEPHSKRVIYIKTNEIATVYLKYVPEYVIFDISLKAEDPAGYSYNKDIFEEDLLEKWKAFDSNSETNTDQPTTPVTANQGDSTSQQPDTAMQKMADTTKS